MWRILLLFALVPACTPSPTRMPENETGDEKSSDERRSEALKRLLEVFGIEDPPSLTQHAKQPPQYMVDLFNTVADENGVTKDPHLLEGNTVRSFFDKIHSNRMHFLFNVSTVAKNEKILTAELHLFKLKSRHSETPFFKKHHFCQVQNKAVAYGLIGATGMHVERMGWIHKTGADIILNLGSMTAIRVTSVNIYQVLDKMKLDSTQGKKLLSSRLIPLQASGWEVFSITQAVRTWTDEEKNNQGLLVTVKSLGGGPMDSSVVRFASGRDHHESKQPMLVVFTDDGRRGTVPVHAMQDDDAEPVALPNEPREPISNRSRTIRSLDWEDEQMPCLRHPLYVDFEEIGWSGWIISPKGYNAYHCKGSCPFPLGQNMRPTNHATVQSIINALKLTRGVHSPCCVPDKLHSINLLYFDDDENVVLRQYDDMVAGSCGCH